MPRSKYDLFLAADLNAAASAPVTAGRGGLLGSLKGLFGGGHFPSVHERLPE